ncbi:M23 family metallopeptidase [Commensalibacter nepenthis]|uniref:M23 family metallopeptidase n=1 Tax=Commensalibacter nepenthis TaxID=3043872 RepID=A0ABT6QAK9_9PROT|nr:M23 family metallopeptidase [Commensalibacter sp. TBRC 10068]MDI2113945.1 M23 family metallopeptidase [Commensalibacter sp. TBRC 10068]
MIISPPFLPDGDVSQSQSSDDFVESFMQLTGDGKFPVSDYFQWHGGVHLVAPEGNNKTKVPVRAIADGKVLYVRQPTPELDNKAGTVPHPQNHQGQEDWCDNGCVVIQHDTEIGEELAVTFYSIYMHLKSIEKTVTQGSDIHRKAKIGQAGQIYGVDGQIHFEIIADEENTKKFLGDLAFNAPSYYTNQYGCEKAFRAQDGRTDACFGSMYFYIPQGVSIYEQSIVEEDKVVHVVNKKTKKIINKTIKINKAVYLPKKQDNGTDITVGQNIYVEMAFDKGKCKFISYDADGKPLAGDPVITKGDSSYTDTVHEYNLYKASLALYPYKPTAGFEILRFGRVIGDEDLAEPATVTHFREIQTPKGKYWVDLNKSYIKKYSDADFPYWKGWGVVNDDTDGDGRCDSKIIGSIVSAKEQYDKRAMSKYGAYGKVIANDKKADYLLKENALASDVVQKKLKRIFYKFPTEWSMDKFDERYVWVKKDHFANDDQKFANFKAHVQSLAFWDEAGIPIDKNHWHFPPIEFIKHFRKCSWLSKYEIRQIIPKQVIRQSGKKYYWESNRHNDFLNDIYVNLNKTLRKYCIITPLRIASFLGNSIQETTWFSSLAEGNGENTRYAPYYGRGLLQLTWEDNYKIYATFIGASKNYDDLLSPLKDPAELKAADSGGVYWALKNANQYVDEKSHTLERVAQPCVSYVRKGVDKSAGTHIYYRSEAFWGAACIVNRGDVGTPIYNPKSINGFPDRCCAYSFGLAILTEMKFSDAQGKLLEFPEDRKQRGIKEER